MNGRQCNVPRNCKDVCVGGSEDSFICGCALVSSGLSGESPHINYEEEVLVTGQMICGLTDTPQLHEKQHFTRTTQRA